MEVCRKGDEDDIVKGDESMNVVAVDDDSNSGDSPQILLLLRRFLDVQRRRAEAYAKLRSGFVHYMADGGEAAYKQLCGEVTGEFSDCSKQVIEMESLLSTPDLRRRDLAEILKSVQAQEKQKLYLTVRLQILKKMGRPSERVRVNEAAEAEAEGDDADYDANLKAAICGVQDAVTSINEHLEQVWYEIEALESP